MTTFTPYQMDEFELSGAMRALAREYDWMEDTMDESFDEDEDRAYLAALWQAGEAFTDVRLGRTADPIGLDDLRTAQRAVQAQLDWVSDMGAAQGMSTDEIAEENILFIAAWNALEHHIAYLEGRNPLNVFGIDPTDAEAMKSLFEALGF